MKHFKMHQYKSDGIRTRRFNANIPENYYNRFQELSESLEINMSELLIRFIDKFDKIKTDNKQ